MSPVTFLLSFGGRLINDRPKGYQIINSLAILLLAAGLWVLHIFRPPHLRSGKWKMPPGPRGWPLLGNMREIQHGGVEYVRNPSPGSSAPNLSEYSDFIFPGIGSRRKVWRDDYAAAWV